MNRAVVIYLVVVLACIALPFPLAIIFDSAYPFLLWLVALALTIA